MSERSTSTADRSSRDRRRQLKALLRKKAEASRSFPLSFAQERLWILDRLDPGNPVYCIPMAMRLRGPLDVDALHRTLTELVARHESLRTKIVSAGDQPMQVVEPAQPQMLTVVDLEHVEPAQREAEAVARAQREACKPFRLDEAPLFRALLLRFSASEHILVVVMHHIISDDWSMAVLFREVALLYKAFCAGQPSPLGPLPVQYADYAVWQRQRLQGEPLQRLLDYWRERLRDVVPLDLPTDQSRGLQLELAGSTEEMQLPPALLAGLRELGRREGATLYMTLLAAFQVLLYRYSGQEDFTVGSPIAGRLGKETEGLVGFFVNTLVLRAELAGDPSFRSLLRRTRQTALDAFQHQELPFERLVDALNPEREGNRNPLFQVMFTLLSAPWPELTVAGLALSVIPLETGTSMFELSFTMREQREGLAISAEYRTGLFRAETIRRMLKHFQVLVEGIVAQPDLAVAQLPLLDEPERRQLLVGWNDTARDYPTGPCVHDFFHRQVEQTPEATALIDGPRQWSYRELDERANRLAHFLERRGVGPDHLVAVRLTRSAELIVAILGVLKAGGAYLPLEPELPAQRLQFTLEDSGADILLTQQALRGNLPEGLRHVICLDADWQEIAACPAEPPVGRTTGEHLAYVIYTSGSTGRPKGVMIEHRALVNYTQAAIEQYGITAADRVLQFAAASFDAHVEEVFPCLARGGTLVLRDDEMLDCRTFLERCRQWQLTFVTLPTAFWHELTLAIAAEGLAVPETLRLLVIGGEQAAPERVAAWFRCVGSRVRLLNTYGPTESTVVATAAELARGDGQEKRVPIGRPLGNVRAYVLDRCRQPVPIGVPGELHIGGASLARGYLHRPELTEERFLPEVFAAKAGARMYKTGDVVRWRSDGRLEFVGRTDQQVKIRGFRIEPGEVEQVLREHPALAGAAVVVRGRAAGDLQLAAYTVARPDETVSPADLRQFLGQRLPKFMIPAAFVALDALPMTASGKLDRRALPEPDWSGQGAAREGEFVAPRTAAEQQLAAIWSEVLHLERVGAQDNFFDLGGHSLLAVQVVSRINRELNLSIPLRDLFEAPTLAALAQRVEAARQAGSRANLPPIRPVPGNVPLPMSYSQEPFWVISHLEQGPPPYAMHDVDQLNGFLDVPALERAFNELLRRHESLRTTFAEVGRDLVQVIAPYQPQPLRVVDMSLLPAETRRDEVRRYARAQSRRPIDLAKGPLVRVELVKLAEEEHLLLVGMHHIIFDGWSMTVLAREMFTAYLALAAGLPPPLPELPIQYADYAVWQRQRLQGEVLDRLRGYWLRKLKDLPALELLRDRPRPEVRTTHSAVVVQQLSKPLNQAIERLSGEEGATKFMTLLAAYQILLCQESGQEDFAVSTPVAGRLRPETENVIGCFLNDLVLRADLSGDPSFRQLLGRVRETVLQAFDHQEMPFMRLVRELNPPRDPRRRTLVQTELIFHNAPRTSGQSAGLDWKETAGETEAEGADFDLCLEAGDNEQGLHLRLCYHADLFDETTAVGMLRHFQEVLEAATTDPDQRLSHLPGGKVGGAVLPAAAPAARPAPQYVAPRSPLERQLAAIWADLLQRERVGIHDHFFELGGDSLLAVQAMLRVQAICGTRLPAATLFAVPTVAAWTQRIEAATRAETPGCPHNDLAGFWEKGDRHHLCEAPSGPFRQMVPVTFFPPAAASPQPRGARQQSLVPLRTDGAATPLCCFHGLGGHVAGFLPLAESLAEARPVYGLQAQGLGDDQPPHDRIEAMAECYLREIRQVQPCGPYLLAGWSMGGLIALEAASRLQAAGEEVALVALLDSYLSDKDLSAQDLNDGSAIRWLAPHLNLPLAELTALPADEQWQRIAERAKLAGGVGANEIRRLAEVCRAHLSAMEAYVPRTYQGRAVLFRAQEGGGPDPRWKSLCPRLCVETVPGNHYSMLRKPHAGALAARLGAYLQETAVPGPAARNP